MTLSRRFVMICVAGVLAACQAETTVAPDNTPDDWESCERAEHATWVGQDIDELDLTASRDMRIIPPETAVTEDYRPNRTNVDLDSTGIVTRVWCG